MGNFIFVKKSLFAGLMFYACALFAAPQGDGWKLVFEDDFNYPSSELEKTWWIQNAPSKHILSSRWRDNAEISDGVLRLLNKKEARGGQEWTSGNMRTLKAFKYGYFECRYKYAASAGVNNAFWLCKGDHEIDVNEGHYPNEINTNVHDRSIKNLKSPGGKPIRHADSRAFLIGDDARPDVHIQLNQPAVMQKIRISSNQHGRIRIAEIGVYEESAAGYPDILKPSSAGEPRLENLARGAKIVASGIYDDSKKSLPVNALDDSPNTSWASQADGEKFIEITFETPRAVACVQFVSGWFGKGIWNNMMTEYKVEYMAADGIWKEIASKEKDLSKLVDLSADYHVYSCEWNEKEIIHFFDGKELRRIKNEWFYEPMYVWLSTAVLLWAGDGKIPETVHNTQMEVEWVKVYQKGENANEKK